MRNIDGNAMWKLKHGSLVKDNLEDLWCLVLKVIPTIMMSRQSQKNTEMALQ